jgi:CheY-like chemotaxis protein
MRNKKILVVDDDADIRFGYQVLLAAHHYDTFVASDSSSTLAEVDAHKPDLIILDLCLPAGPRSESTLPLPEPSGGFLVLERLAADKDLALIPVIVGRASILTQTDDVPYAEAPWLLCRNRGIRKSCWRSSANYSVQQSYLLLSLKSSSEIHRSTDNRRNQTLTSSSDYRCHN